MWKHELLTLICWVLIGFYCYFLSNISEDTSKIKEYALKLANSRPVIDFSVYSKSREGCVTTDRIDFWLCPIRSKHTVEQIIEGKCESDCFLEYTTLKLVYKDTLIKVAVKEAVVELTPCTSHCLEVRQNNTIVAHFSTITLKEVRETIENSDELENNVSKHYRSIWNIRFYLLIAVCFFVFSRCIALYQKHKNISAQLSDTISIFIVVIAICLDLKVMINTFTLRHLTRANKHFSSENREEIKQLNLVSVSSQLVLTVILLLSFFILKQEVSHSLKRSKEELKLFELKER